MKFPKNQFIVFLLLIPVWLLPAKVMANHVAAADISWQCLGSNQVKVTVNLYADCSTPNQQIFTTQSIQLQSVSCSYSGFQTIPLLSGSGVEVATGIYPPCGTTSCIGGSAYGVKKYIYEGILAMPQACSDWIISTEFVTRNSVISTVNNPQSYSLYLEAHFDNLNFPANSSPVFSSPPVSLTCINRPYSYSNGATDAEHDSLSYFLVPARGSLGPGNPVVDLPYSTGYSATSPLSSASGFHLDAQTGVISFSPNQIEVGVVALEIREYRNGIWIGSVIRDMQLNVGALCNIVPDFGSSTLAAVLCNDSVLDLQLEAMIQCSSLSTDGSEFRLLNPSGQPVPVVSAQALNCTGGYSDHIQVTLNNRLVQNGTYHLWTKRGSDSNTLLNRCGNEMAENDTLSFSMNSCFTGIPDLLNVSVNQANDAMEITWQVPAGVSSLNFVRYILYRSDFANGPYLPIDTLTQVTDTFYTDLNVNVPSHEYNYGVRVEINTGFLSSLSDTIASIFLTCNTLPDSTIQLSWTSYYGWSNPVYEVIQTDGNGVLTLVSSPSNTPFVFTKPAGNGTYHVRVRTTSPGLPALVSLSNWCEFTVHNTEVIVPNIITPNDDKKNDKFVVRNLDQYPNSRLELFNRWGRKVYESSDYRNDWDGGNLEDGTYYYILHVADARSSEHRGTLMLIRK